MKIMFNKVSGEILDVSNRGAWQPPDFATTIEIPGDTDTFPWPHPQGPSSCIWDGDNVVINPSVPIPTDPDDELDAALAALDPATAAISDLIAVLRGQTGRNGRISGRSIP